MTFQMADAFVEDQKKKETLEELSDAEIQARIVQYQRDNPGAELTYDVIDRLVRGKNQDEHE